MAIKPMFNPETVQERINMFLDQVRDEQIMALSYVGEQCVEHARSVPESIGFTDRTGNLRSSIGYGVFEDGQPLIISEFGKVLKGDEGVEEGKQLVERLGAQTEGFALVVVAGMDYALYVEAKERDVLTSAEQLAETVMPRMLSELKMNIAKAAE